MLGSKCHVAIVGAGFAGLALAFYLLSLQTSQFKVTIYHKDPLGVGASGVASGLLHPFPAGATKLSFEGFTALHATLSLINTVQTSTDKPLYQEGGIIKLAIEDEDKKNFAKLASKQEGLVFFSQEKIQKYLQVSNYYTGLFIQPGYTIFCKDYLAALARVIHNLGGVFVKETVNSLPQLQAFDKVVLCLGHGIKDFSLKPKLQYVKGQILTMEFPFSLTSKSLIGDGYISVTKDPNIYHVGSSYEHHFKNPFPDLEVAKKRILDPWIKIFPEMSQGKILSCDAGVRVMHCKNYLPFVQKIDPKTFIFTALGSRGLLYHAFLAQKLALALEHDSLNFIHKEFLEGELL